MSKKNEFIQNLGPWAFFKLTFTDHTGMPDQNRLTMFGASAILFLYALVSPFRTRLGMDTMNDGILGALVSIVLGGLGFTSRETVNKINQAKPEAPESVSVSATVNSPKSESDFNPN